MTATEILYVLAVHWLADFVLQSDAMAKGKSTSYRWLTIHVATYAAVVSLLLAVLLPRSPWALLIFAVGTFAAHWLTDYVTSRINAELWRRGSTHWFFVSVGWDQVLHYAQLFFLLEWLRS